MTGRSLHDALLRVLTSADLRQRLGVPDDPVVVAALGAEEAAVLRRADPARLRGLAHFLGRHFYRERIVRLFAGGRALARIRGVDALAVLEEEPFAAVLERAELGSLATAEAVARLVEPRVRAALAGLPYAADLVAYEGALFRAETGPRGWGDGGETDTGVPVRAAQVRVLALEWDVTGLVAAVRRGDREFPVPPRAPTRLLVALAPGGRVTTLRSGEGVERLLAALDGLRSPAEVGHHLGLDEAAIRPVLRQLTELGVVRWRAAPARSAPGGDRDREAAGAG